MYSPSFAGLGVKCVVLHRAKQHKHRIVRTLRVRENISALLQINTRYTVPMRVSVLHLTTLKLYIQQVALQAQSHRRDRVDNGLACLDHINVEDLLTVDALQAGLGTEGSNEPAVQIREEGAIRHLDYSPDGCDAILARG